MHISKLIVKEKYKTTGAEKGKLNFIPRISAKYFLNSPSCEVHMLLLIYGHLHQIWQT